MINIDLPLRNNIIEQLNIGDIVSINGAIVIARDKAHHYICSNLIGKRLIGEDVSLYDDLKKYLKGGVIFHCGPIVRRENNSYKMISAGPTTSSRQELYTPTIIEHFGVKAIIGKGGMGNDTASNLKNNKAIYLNAVGGCAIVSAESIIRVKKVYKLSFGIPEAIWLIDVKNFRCYVTIDCKGESLHKRIRTLSEQNYKRNISFYD